MILPTSGAGPPNPNRFRQISLLMFIKMIKGNKTNFKPV